jgi:serine/threonine-protein kinase RsbW
MQHFEAEIPSSTSEGLVVGDQLISLMERFEYSMRDVFAMRLSLEEGLTNAIRHGNKLDPNKRVKVECDIDSDRIRVMIADQGEGFDPDIVPDPTLDEFIERPSGRGLMLMKAYLDYVQYSDGGRCLTMVRSRNSPLPIVEDD